jgi:carboxypeptidase Taq
MMQSKIEQLKSHLAEAIDLFYVRELLEWDQQCYMPPGGAEVRSQQLSTVHRLFHEKITSPKIGRLLETLESEAASFEPDSDDARLIKVARREYEKYTKVSSEWVSEFAQVTAMAFSVWQEARPENNFAKFQPYLEKIVDLRRQYADFFAPYDHVYDPLLNYFEPGMKTAEVLAIFEVLRPQQVALIQAIAERPQVDSSFLHQPFDGQKQWDFGVEVITRFGYDWKRGRQDKAPHPFTIHFGIDDVRITTRILPDYAGSALFSTLHEAGHALYEQGIDHALARTPLARGTSLAVHESQSRMWENLVGRSLPFWEHFYPRLQDCFPERLRNVDLETFYKGINRVEPSLIRVESDEATYNLHIMLRLELEIALMEGKLKVSELPEAWNARMKDYLGITPPNDDQGVLQDIHWANGYIGYFSTYALGNLISVQLWETIRQAMPDLDDQIRSGEFSPLLGWLRENIHRHGSKFEPQELVQQVTGSKIDPAPYVRYLKNKYGEIYGL